MMPRGFLRVRISPWPQCTGPDRRGFLTRKKWRDRSTPLWAKTVSARGPVHPALSIFGAPKFAFLERWRLAPPAHGATASKEGRVWHRANEKAPRRGLFISWDYRLI